MAILYESYGKLNQPLLCEMVIRDIHVASQDNRFEDAFIELEARIG